jgi:hemolysin III
MATAAPDPSPPAKPRLRGVSHQHAFFVALVAGAALVAWARPATARLPALVFGASLALLLGTSALYHRVQWDPVRRQRMRQLDHAAIFILIAGGYTPLFALVPSSRGGHAALWAIWAGAMIGALKAFFWARPPKWTTAIVCVGLGWTGTGQVVDRLPAVGGTAIALLVAAGVIYSVGAGIYALRRPDPVPDVFGYHEVFHALVIVASGCLFAHVVLVIEAAARGLPPGWGVRSAG